MIYSDEGQQSYVGLGGEII